MQALVLLPLTYGGVYVFGVNRWQNVLARLATLGKRHRTTEGADQISKKTAEVALMVNVAAGHGLTRVRCLQRSLVLWCLLERNGIDSEIRYGARKEDGQLQAHAWVEVGGVALHDNEHRDFSTFQEVTGTNP